VPVISVHVVSESADIFPLSTRSPSV
jgi:hypothetical protein